MMDGQRLPPFASAPEDRPASGGAEAVRSQSASPGSAASECGAAEERVRALEAEITALRAEQSIAAEALARATNELQRLDQLERIFDHLSARGSASHAEAVRRALALEARLDAVGRRVDRQDDRAEAADERAAAQSARIEAVVQSLVALQVAQERDAFPPIRYVREWRARGRDLRAVAPAGTVDQVRPTEAVQLGRFWRCGDVDAVALTARAGLLAGLDLAAWTFLPPAQPIHGLEFALFGVDGTTVAEGACAVEPDIGAAPLRLRFAPAGTPDGSLTLRLWAASRSVEAAGLKLWERRLVSPLSRRVRGRSWLATPVYA